MSSQYVYDKDDFRFRKPKRSPKAVFLRVLKYFVASLSLAVIYYIVFALFFSTDKERRLKSENRMYSRLYPEMEQKQKLLEDVVAGLEVKDNTIYRDLFQTDVVTFGSQTSDFLSRIDSLEVLDIINYSESVYVPLRDKAREIDDDFMDIFRMLASEDTRVPPLSFPLEKFSYTSIGASVGSKINPFYKVKVKHEGLDLIAPAGTSVCASADGVVSSIERSKKGLGNVVSIDHGNGYVTRYAHLSDINVLRGRSVKRGAVIGKVGMSGNSFAPHLHYEIWKDTVAVDPVNYFFSTVSPDEYSAALLMAASAGQTMD